MRKKNILTAQSAQILFTLKTIKLRKKVIFTEEVFLKLYISKTY